MVINLGETAPRREKKVYVVKWNWGTGIEVATYSPKVLTLDPGWCLKRTEGRPGN